MRVRNDEVGSVLSTADGSVRGIERVRGLDAPFGVAHLRLEQRFPVAVEIERRGQRERLPIRSGGGVPLAAFWAAPAVAIILARVMRGKGRN